MKRRNDSARRPRAALALTVLLAGLALFGYSSGRAARSIAHRPKSRIGAQQAQKPSGNPAERQTSSGKDEVAPDNHTPEPRGRIAFASDRDGNFEIYVMNPDGTGQIKLTNDPAEDVQPAWSPDGTRIAFSTNRDGNFEIYTMSADGSGLARLTSSAANERSPAWSPDGTRIACVTDLNGSDDIIVISAVETVAPAPPVFVTTDRADDIDPAWSPDGTKIAFASKREGNFEIYTVNPDGTNLARLTTAQGDDRHPSWSPGRITFQSERDGNDEIYVMNPDGSGQTNITNNPAFDYHPARSSDGTRVVFASTRDGNFEIYAINVNGALARLTITGDAADIYPAVQPLALPSSSAARLFTARLEGRQEVPPTNSPALGVGTVLLSPDEATARVSLTFSGLVAPQTGAHIHTAPVGVAGPVTFPLPLGSFSDFLITLTPAQVQDLKAGRLYFNVHSTTFPNGEIRGQINAAPIGSAVAPPANAFALTTANRLLRFNTGDPKTIVSSLNITGLQRGEDLLGIDVRPATGQLYGLGSTSRLYVINTTSGVATQVGTGPFTPALSGAEFGFDFNPTVDRIRVVSDSGQNLRLNPDTGAVAAVDGVLTYATAAPSPSPTATPDVNAGRTPRISGAAYTNSFAGATTTTLYDIDYSLDILAIQNPPNNGTLNTVGPLGVDTGRLVGFDIGGGSNVAFAALTGPNDVTSRLYSIDLNTGAATYIGDIGSTELVRDIAVGSPTFAGFASFNYTVNEGAGKISLAVTRTGDLSGEAAIDFDTNDGTATERRDYTTAAGVLRFAPGEASKSIDIFITDDSYIEPDETFTVTLRNPTGTAFSGPITVTVTITDNDPQAGATGNPIDSTPFFVRQQYIDFLGREPDQAGFNAWVATLNNCPANDTRCDRVSVSAAFFLSPEFQSKGFYAIRFYLAALGRLPTYREFVRDLYRLNGATADESIAARAAFAEEFAAREEFNAIYDPLSNSAFVSRLLQTSGVTLDQQTRDALVADLNAGRRTRGQVLRTVVENAQFTAANFNRAFVLTEYFGYLRRDPDPAGFQAWLNTLNANPNNFRTMVNGFVNSTEYRLRFGRP